MDVRYDLINVVSLSRGATKRFWNFFCQNFSWTSVSTLLMASVGSEGKTDAFKVQTNSKAEKPNFIDFHVL
ncbi:hypothetical protein H5410_026198 [Solanum commersonii]|uniref:Uncharacterized protein n=1 Tax=Solanum commersonii TaxID=4109 RepID=A0A9J5YWC6_SOLCO|nr:hypothetical protein H5410_026198 [Solanum commersonii]